MSHGKPIRRIAIVGTGVIGASWAAEFLARGFDVVATDPAPKAEANLREYINEAWKDLTCIGLSKGASRDRLSFTTDMREALSEADLVQENAPERPDVKIKLYAEMEDVAPVDSLFASSSSGITPSVIQSQCKFRLHSEFPAENRRCALVALNLGWVHERVNLSVSGRYQPPRGIIETVGPAGFRDFVWQVNFRGAVSLVPMAGLSPAAKGGGGAELRLAVLWSLPRRHQGQDSDAHTYSATTTSRKRPPWTPTSPASCRGPTAVASGAACWRQPQSISNRMTMSRPCSGLIPDGTTDGVARSGQTARKSGAHQTTIPLRRRAPSYC
jgi:NAD(P)-dependent dehydrogenase (short-subunit alcohol dehydrogenase family)